MRTSASLTSGFVPEVSTIGPVQSVYEWTSESGLMDEQSMVPREGGALVARVTQMDNHMVVFEQRLDELTSQLQNWSRDVEGALVSHEGVKLSFTSWAQGVDKQYDELNARIDEETKQREICQTGHEKDVAAIHERFDSLREELFSQLSQDGVNTSRVISDWRKELVTKIENRVNAVDLKMGVAVKTLEADMKRCVEERVASCQSDLVMRMEELKKSVSSVRARMDLMEAVGIAKGRGCEQPTIVQPFHLHQGNQGATRGHVSNDPHISRCEV